MQIIIIMYWGKGRSSEYNPFHSTPTTGCNNMFTQQNSQAVMNYKLPRHTLVCKCITHTETDRCPNNCSQYCHSMYVLQYSTLGFKYAL